MFLQAKPAPRVGQAGNTRNVVGRKECFSVLTTRRIDLDRCQGHRALWSCAISTGNAQRNGVVTRNNYTKPAMWYRGTRVKAPGARCILTSSWGFNDIATTCESRDTTRLAPQSARKADNSEYCCLSSSHAALFVAQLRCTATAQAEHVRGVY